MAEPSKNENKADKDLPIEMTKISSSGDRDNEKYNSISILPLFLLFIPLGATLCLPLLTMRVCNRRMLMMDI